MECKIAFWLCFFLFLTQWNAQATEKSSFWRSKSMDSDLRRSTSTLRTKSSIRASSDSLLTSNPVSNHPLYIILHWHYVAPLSNFKFTMSTRDFFEFRSEINEMAENCLASIDLILKYLLESAPQINSKGKVIDFNFNERIKIRRLWHNMNIIHRSIIKEFYEALEKEISNHPNLIYVDDSVINDIHRHLKFNIQGLIPNKLSFEFFPIKRNSSTFF